MKVFSRLKGYNTMQNKSHGRLRSINLFFFLTLVVTIAAAIGGPVAFTHAAPRNADAADSASNTATTLSAKSKQQNATPVPFMHRPYYGSQTVGQRTTSFVDHDKPWYVNDGIFVRYDGMRWTNVGIGSCTAGVNCYDGHNGYDLNMWYEPVLSVGAGRG